MTRKDFGGISFHNKYKNIMHARAPVFWNCWKRLKSSSTFNEFQTIFPIVIKGEARQNSFQMLENPENDPWYEKLLAPYRKVMTDFASRSWVNSRFSTTGPDPPYLPNEFLKGARTAVSAFYSAKNFALENAMTPALLKALQVPLKGLEEELNLFMKFENPQISNMKVKETWICFGDSNRAKTTLNLAPIHTVVSESPHIYWRYNRVTKNWYYTEMNFEYCIQPSVKDVSVDIPDPSLAQRTEATKSGAVLAIEVEFDLKAESVVYHGETPQNSFFIDRKATIRFETSHFVGKCNSKWKIADVDNFFASQLLKETLWK